MDQDATWYGSRGRRRPHCIRRIPSAPRKGHSTPPPFRPMSIVATVAHLSYCWALVGKWTQGIRCVNQSMSMTTDLYVSSLAGCISKIKYYLLPQKPPVWTDFIRLEAKNITISKNNISVNIFFRFLSVVISKNYLTNAITLCSVCRAIWSIWWRWSKCVVVPNLAVINNTVTMIMQFSIFKMATVRHVGFSKSFNFQWLIGWRGLKRVTMQKLVATGNIVIEISQFFDIQDGSHLPAWIFKSCNF